MIYYIYMTTNLINGMRYIGNHLKEGGIDLLVMLPSLNDKLSLWSPRSVELLRGLVKPRN